MRQSLAICLVAIVIFSSACEDDASAPGGAAVAPLDENIVHVRTSMGSFDIGLYPTSAPITVDNFLGYVNSGFYDGLTFHRVIPDFMIQGGGFTPALMPRDPRDPIPNEAANGLSNLRGTIAMARTSHPQSATSQFFINLKDNPFLDYKSDTPQGYGYAVFGRVVSGMDVVDAIGSVATESKQGMNDVPVRAVIIYSVSQSW